MSFPHHQRVAPVAKHVPGFTTSPPQAEAGAAIVRAQVRLRVRPNTAARGHVDGAWWPRSHEPVTEFPGLVLAMSSWVGPVRRVAYHLDDWAEAEHELMVEDWPVSMAGLTTLQANSVVVTGSGQRRMSLLVVPPDTPGDTARALLMSMARLDATGSVEEILMSHGVRLVH